MPQSSQSSGADLVALLEQADIHRSSLIRVTRSSGLSIRLWLCRRGYDQVGYLRAGQGCPHEGPDALIVAHTCDAAALDRLLAVGPHVREGGVLVFQSHLSTDDKASARDSMARRLAQFGYTVETHLTGVHRQPHVARRTSQAWRKAACTARIGAPAA